MAGARPANDGTVRRAVVTLPAEMDMVNADSVAADLQAALAREISIVVADMTATTFCDSRAVRTLVLAHRHAAASGTELRLVVPSAAVLRVMGVLGADEMLAIYPSLDKALEVQPEPRK